LTARFGSAVRVASEGLERTLGFSVVVCVLREETLPGFVYVVDDDASFRMAVQRRLKLAGYEVVTYASAQQLLDDPPGSEHPGCILLDVQIPGLSGPELQACLVQRHSPLPIVFLTGYADTATTVRAIKAGAQDFLTKPVSSEQLIDAIERALAQHEAVRDQQSKFDLLRSRLVSLTRRERQVFDLVVRGKINKQIAYELGTTERTVKAHRHQVMTKMQAHPWPNWFPLPSGSAFLVPKRRETSSGSAMRPVREDNIAIN
jgi:FixJ family two-component response regulator